MADEFEDGVIDRLVQNLLRERVFVVHYVGDDGTVDVQPDPAEGFLIETVPSAFVRSAQ